MPEMQEHFPAMALTVLLVARRLKTSTSMPPSVTNYRELHVFDNSVLRHGGRAEPGGLNWQDR